MDKIRIMIVDDHALIRDGIRSLLAICDDIEVVGEAADGQQAIERARELTPDVVLMDIALPGGMDGLEATRRIMQMKLKTRVLVVTQHNNREYMLSSIKAGAVGFMPKIAAGSELASAIRVVNDGGSFLYPAAAATLVEDYQHLAEGHGSHASLTAREREIFKLVAEGNTSRKIADMLDISAKTVQGHRLRISRKLKLQNRTQLVKQAIREGLLNIDA